MLLLFSWYFPYLPTRISWYTLSNAMKTSMSGRKGLKKKIQRPGLSFLASTLYWLVNFLIEILLSSLKQRASLNLFFLPFSILAAELNFLSPNPGYNSSTDAAFNKLYLSPLTFSSIQDTCPCAAHVNIRRFRQEDRLKGGTYGVPSTGRQVPPTHFLVYCDDTTPQ